MFGQAENYVETMVFMKTACLIKHRKTPTVSVSACHNTFCCTSASSISSKWPPSSFEDYVTAKGVGGGGGGGSKKRIQFSDHLC